MPPIKTRTTVLAPKQPEIEFVKGPQYASSYCNNVSYAMSQVDLVLTFGEIIDAKPEKFIIEQRARITMSLIQAKVLLTLLQDQIKTYEETAGREIEIPEGMLAKRPLP